MKVFLVALALLLLLPIAFAAGQSERPADVPWYAARRDSSGQAPDPKATREAVIQVYAARAVGWRRALAVHTWIVVKPSDAERYSRYEVMGWGVDNGAPAVRIDRTGPDNYWFGAYPELIADLRGPGVDAMIEKVKAAVERYPYPSSYTTWPGPNSNTFTAFVAREVPELRLSLPPTAIGKDYLPGGSVLGSAPSGTGLQLSLFGLAGLTLAKTEGVEVNLLGFTFGISAFPPALKLPGVGTI
ncbi:MAG: DUF3750 domain-containing protein [Alphaproteobacteria bacterium]|nr:DUF3750 domain-containing protein [Alphaproteobacteria bacterium]